MGADLIDIRGSADPEAHPLRGAERETRPTSAASIVIHSGSHSAEFPTWAKCRVVPLPSNAANTTSSVVAMSEWPGSRRAAERTSWLADAAALRSDSSAREQWLRRPGDQDTVRPGSRPDPAAR
jgi:hypothetical protein